MVAADLFVVPAALWAAFALKFDSWSIGFERSLYFYVGVAASSTLIFAASGLYRAVVRYISMRVLMSILAGVTSSAVVLWGSARRRSSTGSRPPWSRSSGCSRSSGSVRRGSSRGGR
jgi:FlaA1/EpsC-like NDP-sugar epimerase